MGSPEALEASEASDPGVLDVGEADLVLARRLVAIARRAIEVYMDLGEEGVEELVESLAREVDGRLSKKAAVFVTLERLSRGSRELRGCIGFVAHHLELGRAVAESAVASAFKDPRFPPLSREELGNIVVEIALLGPRAAVRDPSEIVMGRDALYIEAQMTSGILLPQVPVEYCWDVETFLGETCLKAGLDPACWLRRGVRVYRIPGKVFYEKEPAGRVVERDLPSEYVARCSEILGSGSTVSPCPKHSDPKASLQPGEQGPQP